MASPLLPLTLALIAGIIAAKATSLPIIFPLIPFFGCLGLAWIFYLRHRLKTSLVLAVLTFFFFGSTYYFLKNKAFETNPLRLINSPDYVDMEGQIEKSPDFGRDRLRLWIKTQKVIFQGKEKTIRGRLQVSFPISSDSPRPEILAGDKVRLSARLLADDDFSNFQEPISLTVMKARGVHRRGYSKSLILLEKIGAPQFSLRRFFSWLSSQLQKKIERHFRDNEGQISQEGAFLEALLLGERSRLDERTLRTLQSSGLFHLIAISGAHIAIISYFLFHFLRLWRFSDRLRSLVIILGLLFYAFLVEGRPSVVRATTMAILYLFSRLLWKDASLLNTLSAACFLLLLLNPLQLFEAGFILTFIATLTIILFFPKIKKYFPVLPFRLTDLAILSIAAQLGVIPFIAQAFNRVTLGSLILNIPAVPLIGLIMATGWLFLLTSAFSFSLGSIMAIVLKKIINFFFVMAHLFDGFHPFSYRIPTPPFFIIVGYFFFLFLLIAPRRFRYQKLATLSGFSVFAFFLLIYPFSSSSPHLRLTFLDVGQGEATLVEFPGHEKMLIDGGGFQDSSFDVGEEVVCPFLWRHGIKKVDYVVLTHAHPDHLNGLKAVARNFAIKEFWEATQPSESKDYEELMGSLRPQTKHYRYFRGDKRVISGFSLEFLHPSAERRGPAPVSNEDSLVFRLSHEQGLVLFSGDIGESSEQELLLHQPHLQALVLKSPHHGSRTSSSEPFLGAVNPEIIIISAGRNNIYGVPHPEVLKRYEKTGALILRTDLDGAIELIFKEKELRIRTSRTHLDFLRPLN